MCIFTLKDSLNILCLIPSGKKLLLIFLQYNILKNLIWTGVWTVVPFCWIKFLMLNKITCCYEEKGEKSNARIPLTQLTKCCVLVAVTKNSHLVWIHCGGQNFCNTGKQHYKYKQNPKQQIFDIWRNSKVKLEPGE